MKVKLKSYEEIVFAFEVIHGRGPLPKEQKERIKVLAGIEREVEFHDISFPGSEECQLPKFRVIDKQGPFGYICGHMAEID